ncbi:MAG: hypothetical protein RL238_1340 [Actinomycetota bacterium]
MTGDGAVTPTVVLIGPVAAGKSSVGAALASLLGRPFVDLDEVAAGYYDEAGQPVSALIDHAVADGFVAAHRWWQPARAHAVQRVVEEFGGAVVALGAGHSHFEDDAFIVTVEQTLADALVVLLLPEPDVDASVDCLRRRCVAERGADQDWLHDEVDFIRDWVVSAQNRSLADVVVYDRGRSIREVADEVARATSNR